MQVSTELRNMFSYSFLTITIFIIICLILIIQKYINNNYKKEQKIVVVEPKKYNKDYIKYNYLNQLDNLITSLNQNKINNKEAYHDLSCLLREFVYEMTNIKVQNYTLSDIKNLNIPALYELVNNYYKAEFSNIDYNIFESINETRKVIKKWN